MATEKNKPKKRAIFFSTILEKSMSVKPSKSAIGLKLINVQRKTKSSKTASYNITETTMNLNSTTDDLPKSINYTEITTSYNWTSPEPSKFTDLLNTTHAPPNTTFVMNITTIRLGFCSENSDCLNGGFCRRTKRFEYFCDCPPNFTGERCEVNLCGEMDRLCGSLGAICKIIGQNAICECPPNKIHNPVSGICEDACVHRQCLHGSCETVGQYYRCNCHEGYTGFHCDEVVRKKDGNYSALIASITSFLLFICLLLTGTFYFICKIYLTLKTLRIPENAH
ncbi:UNVERIFIED_CONTAM: Fat3 [Trichonephila clavipes]